jgi:hypothetical protein
MARRLLVLVGALALACSAQAEPVSITAFDRGWYSQSGFHDPSNNNYLTGQTADGELRSWFVFDLSSVSPRALVGARLLLDGRFWFTDSGSETFQVTSTTTSRQSLAAGTAGAAGFSTLGNGAIYGSFTRTGFINGNAVVDLNPLFQSGIPYGGFLVLSGRLTTLSPAGTMFGSSSDAEGGFAPQLVLDDGLPPVPLPSAFALGAGGLAAMALRRRRP